MAAISKEQFAAFVKDCRFTELFVELGWDRSRASIPPIEVGGEIFEPIVAAEKRGFQIIVCKSTSLPAYPVRQQLAASIKKLLRESLIIFHDENKRNQAWLYLYNDGTRNRKVHITYNAGQDVQRLYERTSGLFFSIDEQDEITILDVVARFRADFTANAEQVTKRFYDKFKKEHTKLLDFMTGITETVDREWYASIMLNRLMFCYFMQRRGFLNHDRNYLRTKLNESKEKLGEGKFYSFYRSFLLVLFQKGFAEIHHEKDVVEMIGDIPYLNGGLFDLHEIEQKYEDIDVSDEAFERIFDLFDQYEWHLDTRENATGNEISPDVLGYIFEKYINDRAKMGAYYTKEDITDYIGKNTILPYLLEAVAKVYPDAYKPNGLVWKFLSESGDRYVYDSVKHGVYMESGEIRTLPEYIEIGVDTNAPDLFERRKDWNTPAPDEYALPTEIWREVVERRNRCLELLERIKSGGITNVTDLITYNLNITEFVVDLLDTIEDPKYIKLFYAELLKITVLDPTCGSGAFLFAALNILEPLYDSCLNRMQDYLMLNKKGILERSTQRYFDEQLEIMEDEIHPNQNYYIFKSIILNNLYGVDIMREAVETAKLRLFLKLVSTADPDYAKDNVGIEPLPDIDFNIKAGNTLIGFANQTELDESMMDDFVMMSQRADIKEAMFELSKATVRYKQCQLGLGDYRSDDFKLAKDELSQRQEELRDTLDKALKDWRYSTVPQDRWENDYQPFHWVSEFYSIVVERGGFDVIIGNPPYVKYSNVSETYSLIGYETLPCGNLYAFVIERALHLVATNKCLSMIIPLTAISNNNMQILRELLHSSGSLYASSYEVRPSKLFDGVDQRLTIFILNDYGRKKLSSTGIIRWTAEQRPTLFELLCYVPTVFDDRILRFSHAIDNAIYNKYIRHNKIEDLLSSRRPTNNENSVSYRTAGVRYWIIFLNRRFDSASLSNKTAWFNNAYDSLQIAALLNSNLFWWYYSTNYDMFNLKDYMIFGFRWSYTNDNHLRIVSEELEHDLEANKKQLITNSRTRGTVVSDRYFKRLSKPIVDSIDSIIAGYYGFTEEELDYIINYDIKWRMGIGNEGDDDE
jgi:hypothetical protein